MAHLREPRWGAVVGSRKKEPSCRYTAQAGRWRRGTAARRTSLNSISGSNDGAQLWAVGTKEPSALHGAGGALGGAEQRHDELAPSDFRQQRRGAIVGGRTSGTILHYTAQAGRWEAQSSGANGRLTPSPSSARDRQFAGVSASQTVLSFGPQDRRPELPRSGLFLSDNGSEAPKRSDLLRNNSANQSRPLHFATQDEQAYCGIMFLWRRDFALPWQSY